MLERKISKRMLYPPSSTIFCSNKNLANETFFFFFFMSILFLALSPSDHHCSGQSRNSQRVLCTACCAVMGEEQKSRKTSVICFHERLFRTERHTQGANVPVRFDRWGPMCVPSPCAIRRGAPRPSWAKFGVRYFAFDRVHRGPSYVAGAFVLFSVT